MNFTIETKAFKAAINGAAKAIGRKGMPIIQSLRITATDGRVEVTASDLECAVFVTVATDVIEPGISIIPAKLLGDMLKAKGSPKVTNVNSGTAPHSVVVNSATIMGLDPADFPEVPLPTETIASFSAESLQYLIGQTNFAISKEESRFTLNGALLELGGSGAVMVATDGHRLALAERAADQGASVLKPGKALIPAKGLALVDSLIWGTVTVSRDETRIAFVGDGVTVVTRVLDGNFPDYRRVLPNGKRLVSPEEKSERVTTCPHCGDVTSIQSNSGLNHWCYACKRSYKYIDGDREITNTVSGGEVVNPAVYADTYTAYIPREELLATIEAARPFTNERSRMARFSLNGSLVLKAETVNAGTFERSVEYASDIPHETTLEIGFNLDYWRDWLKAQNDETVTARVSDSTSPIDLYGDGGSRCVLMPMRA